MINKMKLKKKKWNKVKVLNYIFQKRIKQDVTKEIDNKIIYLLTQFITEDIKNNKINWEDYK